MSDPLALRGCPRTEALGCLIAAPAGLLVFGPSTQTLVVLALFVIAGLGFGLPLGIVDARALSYIAAARQGTASGVLNLFRIGSEAVFVAAYGWALTAVIGHQPGAPGHVQQIAAGQRGHAGSYTAAMHPVPLAVSALCAIALIIFTVLSRRAVSRRTLRSVTFPERTGATVPFFTHPGR